MSYTRKQPDEPVLAPNLKPENNRNYTELCVQCNVTRSNRICPHNLCRRCCILVEVPCKLHWRLAQADNAREEARRPSPAPAPAFEVPPPQIIRSASFRAEHDAAAAAVAAAPTADASDRQRLAERSRASGHATMPAQRTPAAVSSTALAPPMHAPSAGMGSAPAAAAAASGLSIVVACPFCDAFVRCDDALYRSHITRCNAHLAAAYPGVLALGWQYLHEMCCRVAFAGDEDAIGAALVPIQVPTSVSRLLDVDVNSAIASATAAQLACARLDRVPRVRAARANASAIHSADERMASAATTLIARSISTTELRIAQVASVRRAVRMNDMVAPLFGHAESASALASASALNDPQSASAAPAAASFLMAGSSDIVASTDLAADLALRDTGFTPFALPLQFRAVSASSSSSSLPSSSSSTSEPQPEASAASLADRVAEAEREAARFEATLRESSRQLNAAARQFEASLYGEL